MANYSRQRECIIEDLAGRFDHPTADMVYESVRKRQPNISLGTVYRNLSLLAESGQILKISTGNGPDHYDGHTHDHMHFICKCCGAVLDMDLLPNQKLTEEASKNFDGQIENYAIQFYGKCNNCLSVN